MEEQGALGDLLQHFMEGQGVMPGAVDGPNALLIVNHRSSDMRVERVPRWLQRGSCIDIAACPVVLEPQLVLHGGSLSAR